MRNSSLERSVDSLQKIYAVIIALAIGKILQEATKGENSDEILNNLFKVLPILLSFFIIVVPFYQGMNRHLDICYLEKEDKYSKLGLLIDFFFFCIESSLLFIFANSIGLGKKAFIVLAIVLIIDIFWGSIAHFIHYRKEKPSVIKWTAINVFTIFAGFFIYVYEQVISIDVTWVLFVLLLGRAIADYWMMKDFYFPSNERDTSK